MSESTDFPRLVVIVGLPRSGKSTVVKKWYVPHGYAAVSYDMIRHVLQARRSEIASHLTQLITFAAADSLLAMGNRVVVDSIHATRSSRDHWLKRGAFFHYVSTPIEVCLERARGQSNACDVVPVIEEVAREFEPPGDWEPQWSPPAEELKPETSNKDAETVPA